MKGRSFLIRFDDDLILGFEREEDARWVMEVLRSTDLVSHFILPRPH